MASGRLRKKGKDTRSELEIMTEERDEAKANCDQAIIERNQAIEERDQARMERNAAIDAVAEEKDNFDVEEQRRQDIITAVENTTGKVLEAICRYRICPYEPMGNNKTTKTCGICHDNRRGHMISCSRCNRPYHCASYLVDGEIQLVNDHFIHNANPTDEHTPSCFNIHMHTCQKPLLDFIESLNEDIEF